MSIAKITKKVEFRERSPNFFVEMTVFFDLYCVTLPTKTITLQYISLK